MSTEHRTAIFNSNETQARSVVPWLAVVTVGDRMVKCFTCCPWPTTLDCEAQTCARVNGHDGRSAPGTSLYLCELKGEWESGDCTWIITECLLPRWALLLGSWMFSRLPRHFLSEMPVFVLLLGPCCTNLDGRTDRYEREIIGSIFDLCSISVWLASDGADFWLLVSNHRNTSR